MIDVLIPETATILQWLKKEGEQVAAGDLLVEIETDKTVFEVEAPDSGTVIQIHVPAQTAGVAAGTRIATIGSSISAAADTKQQHNEPVEHAPNNRLAISPLARRLAQESGLDVTLITGSGPGGRIVGRDIRLQLEATVLPPNDADESGAFDMLPIDGMRRTIAERLSESASTVPHFYLSCDIRMDGLLELRRKLNSEIELFMQPANAAFTKLSINDFIIKAVAASFHSCPELNVIWEGHSIRRFKQVDIGLAVAIDNGLITPILRDVHHKSLSAIAAESRDLASRARVRRLHKGEYEGGATTVSNLGMYGTERFTAIINPPQSSIFAIGAVRQQVVVENNAPAIVWVSTVTLSCDHRVIDGAGGAQLLDTLRKFIETPMLLLA